MFILIHLMISNAYIDSSKEINNKNRKLKTGDGVRISKYKNNFAKGYAPNWSGKEFVIKKVKNTWTCICRGHVFLVILKEKKLLGRFTKKNYKRQKTNQNQKRVQS